MIGIVVVSHSHALAEAAIALASEMITGDDRPALVNAGGLDDGTLGTDAARVAAAIEEADAGDGVLVLLDLGSAVLSAELALEFCDADVAARTTITPAPLVEGLVAAAVAAAGGATVDEAAAEASAGLLAKQGHLGDGMAPAPGAVHEAAPAGATLEVDVTAPHGLHARPAARLASLVRSFDAEVRVSRAGANAPAVPAHSLSRVATLEAGQGSTLLFEANGPGAQEALDAIAELAATGFGDVAAPTDHDAATDAVADDTDEPGADVDIVIGPATVVARDIEIRDVQAADPAAERELFDAAIRSTVADLRDQADRAGSPADEILRAQALMADDADVADEVRAAIAAGEPAARAFDERMRRDERAIEQLQDPYLRARAHDVATVRLRVLARILDHPWRDLRDAAGVLVVDELDPADAGAMPVGAVSGVVTRRGGAAGHGVIVARSRGIPVFTDADEAVAAVADGQVIAFDRSTRELVVDPDEATLADFERRRSAEGDRQEIDQRHAAEPATTTDGTTVHVAANVVSVSGARAAARAGADGSGLVRTEVLFADRALVPSRSEQESVLREIAEAMAGARVTVRTFDAGADKPLTFAPQAPEPNPFLGVRGIRGHGEFLDDQVAAIVAVARDHPVSLMFPMVTTRAELDAALATVDRACAAAGGRPQGLRVGIMVEVPASALRVASLTRGLDFVSIGTNDLTQYVTASDRTNPAVAHLADAADPAVLALVARTCAEVAPGVAVAVCGDAAADPLLAPVLVGLGVRELSVPGSSVARIKAALRRHSIGELGALAARCLAAEGADEVRSLLAPA